MLQLSTRRVDEWDEIENSLIEKETLLQVQID
jgi:hypothetical protein